MEHKDYIELENAANNLMKVISDKLAEMQRQSEDESLGFKARLDAMNEAEELESYLHDISDMVTRYGY